jgi:beta-galactosidase
MDTLASLQAVAHGSDTVQYFQWRKSRGSVEKFHGAVVDHVGTKETRIFNTVKRTGELLKIIDEVAGSNVVSRVALVFDWENMWALDDSQGFQKDQKKYYETCYSYYKLFWEKGVSVDIVRAESDWSGYDLVVAPMLYMVSEKTARKMADFVENGGHLYATYMLGMVNETDLCHLGGFPCGELKNVFGIWNEEIDSLYPEERVAVSGGWQAKDYCELIHPRGAEVKAVYESEFYAGMPAFTVNAYGKGKAYYQAFRHVGDFAKAQMEQILRELGIVGTIPDTREGVTAHKRCADGAEYLFVENYNGEEARDVSLGGVYTDMESGEKLQSVTLPAYGIRVLKR